MTLIIRKNADGSGEVENTESTEVSIGGAKVNVGGSFKNTGKVRVLPGGVLDVDRDFLNEGHLSINDPEKIKQIIIETLKTTKSVADFGTEILKKFNLLQ
ncbi:hypothetical protein A3C91_03135 [Candidatus Azambacteria bacterium RIFCSPHIGHO2_02_FULL_52_12]|uniref:Uncharacterized protein n=1 Tax=Candidatus Azambacteria bacterium RIFCSPLOWO2_01_FULL_46_25 TaxID=1797298 RepID=A0A1F5BT68_9BACT|nr:MAG: hypothetical protein A3C91_03135 [Candidatus Azambacteria bacterium RIFCSPHIGHO2_02_FULL_52_12]OGD33826.1 MAG: hypothetical protein A2988_02000 [Candidatus Azambacteria bacterium RIFCSPLOWO2_01_FULL_46_25]OGD36586.1 MAG: hypothetical protein A2850_01665 [Candidatus Azambacteria bacterium RIFCSPHIGHO2_01_FULL_51_74]